MLLQLLHEIVTLNRHVFIGETSKGRRALNADVDVRVAVRLEILKATLPTRRVGGARTAAPLRTILGRCSAFVLLRDATRDKDVVALSVVQQFQVVPLVTVVLRLHFDLVARSTVDRR